MQRYKKVGTQSEYPKICKNMIKADKSSLNVNF